MPMPMADLFQPDANFVPQRAIYPTSPGGTLTSASSAMTQATNSVVVDPRDGSSGVTTTNPVPISTSGRSAFWWLGFVAFLLAMVIVARKAGGPEDFRNIRPTFYNFLTITLTSIVGIVGAKVIAAKYRIPGASDIILAV